MADILNDKENLIHIAAAIFLCGFLFRDQIMLRSLVIVGNCVYVLYYYVVVDHPLWGGIFWSVVGIIINIGMIAWIMADRSRFGLAAHELALHARFGTLTPGEFRRLMRVGTWHTATNDIVLSEEGRPQRALAYVIEGGVTVAKGDGRIDLEAPLFIGEVAFVTDHPASATATGRAGARYVTWDMETLRKLLLRTPGLRVGLGAALNEDMARKIARA